MSYAVYVKLPNENPATNGVRFATREEADAAGHELLSRWFVPESFEVREAPESVNYRFDFEAGRPVSLGTAAGA